METNTNSTPEDSHDQEADAELSKSKTAESTAKKLGGTVRNGVNGLLSSSGSWTVANTLSAADYNALEMQGRREGNRRG